MSNAAHTPREEIMCSEFLSYIYHLRTYSESTAEVKVDPPGESNVAILICSIAFLSQSMRVRLEQLGFLHRA